MFQLKKQVKTFLQPNPNIKSIHKKHPSSLSNPSISIQPTPFPKSTTKQQSQSSIIQNLLHKNQQLHNKLIFQQHQSQRSKHLLSIKQQFLITQQKEINDLKQKIRRLKGRRKDKEGNCGNDGNGGNCRDDENLNELSKIESIDQEDEQEGKQNRGFETKRKICLKKNIGIVKVSKIQNLQQQSHKLQLIKLKQQINHLKQQVSYLQAQLQIFSIQNEHISKDYQITNRRQRKLQQSLINYIRQKGGEQSTQQEISLDRKCAILEKYIDKLTEKVSQQSDRIDNVGSLPILPMRKCINQVHPPITPHFSSNTFVFPLASKKTPSKNNSHPFDQIFQARSSFSDEDFPSKQ